MNKVIVKLEHVNKNFDNKEVINDFNLEVFEKEFLTILGPSGCGKTTILRMISGLEKVSSGKIFIDNIDVTDIDASKREVNTIFQNYALFTHMNVEDNIAFGLKMKKIPKNKIYSEVEKMLDLVHLKGYNKKFPNELSGGEQQRVAIARGLINKPKVLLLDEPLSSLDYKLKKEMQVELKRLQKKLKITFIYVTHNQEEALSMSDRILVLNRQKEEQLDIPEIIYNNPKTKFVADFIGESNVFESVVIKIEKEYAYVSILDNNIVKIINKDYTLGEKIYIMIRPENVVLDSHARENTIKVKVKECIYNGTMIRLIVLFNGKELKINAKTSQKYNIDDEIIIGLNTNSISSFKD